MFSLIVYQCIASINEENLFALTKYKKTKLKVYILSYHKFITNMMQSDSELASSKKHKMVKHTEYRKSIGCYVNDEIQYWTKILLAFQGKDSVQIRVFVMITFLARRKRTCWS